MWGSAFPGIKYVFSLWDHQSLPMRLLFAGTRFMLAGIFVLCFSPRPFQQLRQADLRLLLALSLTQTFFQYIFFYTGLAISSGILGSLLVGTGSFWWMLLAPLLLKTPRPTPKHWLVLVISTMGIAIAVYAPGAGSGLPVLGGLCFLISTFSGALALIILRPLGKSLDIRAATGFSLLLGGFLLCLCGLPGYGEYIAVFEPRMALMTVYLACVSATAFGLWNHLAHEFPVNILAGYRFLIPLSGIIQSSLLIEGEVPGLGIFIGGTLVLGSIYYLSRIGDTRKQRINI